MHTWDACYSKQAPGGCWPPMRSLGSGVLEVGDEVIAVLLLLQAGEDHLRALDVLLRCEQVVEQGVLGPQHTRLLVGRRVGVAFYRPRRAAEQAVEVGPLLVSSSLLDRVALRALGLEDLGSLSDVTHDGYAGRATSY
eukprot:scaffold1311_cov256-Pinguiococcus_pyrenoidosus.AAC.56